MSVDCYEKKKKKTRDQSRQRVKAYDDLNMPQTRLKRHRSSAHHGTKQKAKAKLSRCVLHLVVEHAIAINHSGNQSGKRKRTAASNGLWPSEVRPLKGRPDTRTTAYLTCSLRSTYLPPQCCGSSTVDYQIPPVLW